jgi:metal-sulfur cluster biosynthetic enzyme
MITPEPVLRELAAVRDPELDEPVTELGFIDGIEVEGRSVHVRLRLPTYFCAPNFAFMMADDARRAVSNVEGVEEVRVTLVDHHASDEINAGVAAEADFQRSFPGEATGGLEEVRNLFRSKAFVARQERLARSLGAPEFELQHLVVRDLPPGADTDAYLERRAELGIDCSATAAFLVTPDGRPIPPEMLRAHLRFARTIGVSIEGNAAFCRGLLKTRYALTQEVRT